MRIAFISLMGGMPWGGSEVLWSKTARLALDEGHHVFISVYDWGSKNPQQVLELKEKGALVHFRKKWNPDESILKKLKRRLGTRWNRFSKNWNPLVRFKPDMAFISQGDNFDLVIHHKELYNILIKNNINYSLICHGHAQYSHFLEYDQFVLAREIFNKSNIVYFVSNRQKDLTERKLAMKLSNSSITWNPLNLKDYNYIPWPSYETIQMAIVGSLVSGKGHDTLFEVLSDKNWQERDYLLNIYGKGDGEAYLKELCKFYCLEHKVNFMGNVSSATEIWENNHILLIPSSGEGLPISLVEAAICGRPAVVTDVGGNREIIINGLTGFIADAPSVYSYSVALENAWKNIEKWEELGMKNRNLNINTINVEPETEILNFLKL
ncbi:MAG: glycosyltransferase family 4 protein [Bacteroidales bacterium]